MDGLNFRPLTFAEEPLLRRYLTAADSLSCEMSLANLLLWLPDTGSIYTEYKGRLLIAAVGDGMLFFPLGERFAPSELADIFAGIRGMGIAADEIYDVPPDYIADNPDLPDYFLVEQSPDYADYIYDLQKLVEMSGGRLRKKRNLIRQFEREYPDAILGEITRDNFEEFIELSHRLFAATELTPTLEQEISIWPMVEKNFFRPELGLGSLTLSVNGRMIGFAIYSCLGQSCYDIHFEKVDHTFKGAGQYLVRALADKLCKLGGKLMNREQDLGLPGLRQAKETLDPLLLYRRGVLKPRQS